MKKIIASIFTALTAFAAQTDKIVVGKLTTPSEQEKLTFAKPAGYSDLYYESLQVQPVGIERENSCSHYGFQATSNDNGRSYAYVLYNNDKQVIGTVHISPLTKKVTYHGSTRKDYIVFEAWAHQHHKALQDNSPNNYSNNHE